MWYHSHVMEREGTFYLVSLGCPKNTVDAEGMAELLRRAGYRRVSRPELAEYLIVNTCGFIKPAQDESLGVLRELSEDRLPDQKLIAAGCLAQYYGESLLELVPGLNGIIGTRRWMDVVGFLARVGGGRPFCHLPADALTVGDDEGIVLRAAVQGASAYLKIADGCRRPCAFCAIPKIKGTLLSRPINRVLADAAELNAAGVKEIILLAQDTTDYGHDLGMRDGLAVLLRRLVKAAPDVPWIRIMYAFPGYVTGGLIEVMASLPQVLHYLDMPLQHAHPEVLRRMRRPANVDAVWRTLERLRAAMPDIALRTTFIVGYPGETEAEFQTLMDFVAEARFDHVGVFKYWPEPGTPAADLPDQVPDEVKEERYRALMEMQQAISLERNREQIGRELDVLIEGRGDGITVGRTYRDAPEIDGLAIFDGDLPPGAMIRARVTGAMPYDLMCVPAD